MRSVSNKVKRSEFYESLNTIVPINHVLKARFDVMGSAVIISLLLGVVSLMRSLLVWVQ
jgi:hypothetical protein